MTEMALNGNAAASSTVPREHASESTEYVVSLSDYEALRMALILSEMEIDELLNHIEGNCDQDCCACLLQDAGTA